MTRVESAEVVDVRGIQPFEREGGGGVRPRGFILDRDEEGECKTRVLSEQEFDSPARRFMIQTEKKVGESIRRRAESKKDKKTQAALHEGAKQCD